MGRFDYTCAVSRTSLHAGDEVLYVALNDKETTEGLLSRIHSLKRTAEYWKEDGTHSTERFEDLKSRFLRHIDIGVYDDYGSIEGYDHESGLDIKQDWWDYQFMVHRSVAEALIQQPLDKSRLYNQLEIIVERAFLARVSLVTPGLVGAQYYDRKEIELQETILKATQVILDKKKIQLDDWDNQSRYLDEIVASRMLSEVEYE